ncbi:MAG: adenosylcobinamide-phosphate synthase CbiB [Parasporobacterium sp.]|nr:adenosylcobinamide-phosphate synthase CbiB [Parasporobacterium sp.]
MEYHIIAFFAGFVLDLIIGDPYNMPHPIRLIGKYISVFENDFLRGYRSAADDLKNGIITAVLVPLTTVLAVAAALSLAYFIHPIVGVMVEAIMTYYILATKSLKDESMKVYYALKCEGLEASRKAVSMIVGRDTNSLDETGVAKAAIETVAENTSDGVIAPMLFTALGGPALGFLYKAVNTMDSMIGYKNDKYLYFGRAAAKMDDVLNFLPARISAGFMIFAAYMASGFNGPNAKYIYLRDRYKHASPNSAHTEAVSAGALEIQLAGPASYFGKIHEKEYIGDPLRPVEVEDIRRVNRLMYITAWISEILCLIIMIVIAVLAGLF